MRLGPMDVVTLYVADWPGALAWYRDVLGLTVLYTDADRAAALITPTHRGAVLVLARGPASAPAWVPAFHADDVGRSVARLLDQGVVRCDDQPATALHQRSGGQVVRLLDPEGNPFDVYA